MLLSNDTIEGQLIIRLPDLIEGLTEALRDPQKVSMQENPANIVNNKSNNSNKNKITMVIRAMTQMTMTMMTLGLDFYNLCS